MTCLGQAINLKNSTHLALIMDGTRRYIGEPVDTDVKDSAYRVYTASHCRGYLSLIGYDGMVTFTAGPFPGRNPDGVYVTNSGINDNLRAVLVLGIR